MQNNSGQPAEQLVTQERPENQTEIQGAVNQLLLALLEETRTNLDTQAGGDAQLVLATLAEATTVLGLPELIETFQGFSTGLTEQLAKLSMSARARKDARIRTALYPIA